MILFFTMRRKGAIGLSINTLVVVIISLVILGAGITLLYKFIGGARDIKEGLDQRTDQELEYLLVDQGKQVALPLHTTTLRGGDGHIFGVGILNIGGEGDNFQIQVNPPKFINKEGETIENYEAATTWLLYHDELIIINEGEHHKESISVDLPNDAPKGQYIFNVKIFAGEDQYGNTQKFYVNVE